MSNAPPRIHIIGRKNSGKTTLIVELVQELCRRGLKVGTIKHTHHHHEFDAPGKDSFRHRQAGASVVGLVGPKMVAAFREIRDDEEQPAMQKLDPLFAECDFVLVEGNQQSTGKKVEVWREASGQTPLAHELPGILAVVTDDHFPDRADLDSTCPLWPRADVAGLVDRLLAILL